MVDKIQSINEGVMSEELGDDCAMIQVENLNGIQPSTQCHMFTRKVAPQVTNHHRLSVYVLLNELHLARRSNPQLNLTPNRATKMTFKQARRIMPLIKLVHSDITISCGHTDLEDVHRCLGALLQFKQ